MAIDRVEGRSEVRKALTVGAAGLLIGLAYALRLLVPNGWDPSVFVAFGELSHVQTDYGRELLGEVVVRPQLGHDGRFFFAQANDPLYLEPERHAVVLDRPLYRAQRMLYPALVGLLGLLPPMAIAWGMGIVNVVFLGLGSVWLAWLAAGRHASPWVGLGFALNFALINELDIGGAGVVAFALGVAGVAAWERGRHGLAVAAVAGAVLARELMVIFVFGLLAAELAARRRVWWTMLAVPPATAAGWRLYLVWRLRGIPGGSGVGQTLQDLSWPLSGLVAAWRAWLSQPLDMAMNLTILAVLGAFVWRAVRSRDALAWSALGFAALALFLSAAVWTEPYDISRALAPVFTAYAVLLLAPGRDDERETGRALPRVGEAAQRP